MKRSWTAFYKDEHQSSYFYDTENNKMYKCPNDLSFPKWSAYIVVFLGAVLSNLLNQLFMPMKSEKIGFLFVAVTLLIGCAAVCLIMKYVNKMIDGLVYELMISPEQMSEYIGRGRKKFKRDTLIIGITVGIAIIVLVLSVWLFFIIESTYILVITALTWVLVLLCGFGFQPVKRYKLYKKGITGIHHNGEES